MYKIIGKQEKTIRNLGGKGSNLLKLDKLKFTPNFIIIDNSIFNEYLKKDRLLFDYLKNNFPERINLRFIKKRILQFKPDKNLLIKINNALDQLNINKFIIRSSFISEDSKNLSYAGLFSSYRCRRKTDIFLNIKKVWASQFTERVFVYQKETKDFKYGMAIIIQDFIQSDFSGVIFLLSNNLQEILIEYCEKSYQAVQSGTKSPINYLIRDGYHYLNSVESESHQDWIQNLISKVSKLESNNLPLDIEFAVFKNKVYLLQARPLTKKIDTRSLFFIFERQKRWKYHLDDFSIQESKKIFKKCGLFSPLKIRKKDDGVFISADSYFSFVDNLKKKSTNLKILNNFYKYFLRFILSEYKKARSAKKELIFLVSLIKKLNFKMSLLDFIHNLFLKNLKGFLIKKYHFKEDKNLEYFIPPISFATYKLLLTYQKNKKFYDSEILEHLKKHLNKGGLNRLVKNIKTNHRKIRKCFNKLKREQKKLFWYLKKLIWLRDVVDYYYEEITAFSGKILSSIFDKRNIKFPFTDPLKICHFSLAEISKISENKFSSWSDFLTNLKKEKVSQKNYTFPLKGVIASKGNFSGTVRVIRNIPDIKKISPKDILVAQYTCPSLVVGMAICKGIITEEGGLTSHAAIVSRELGKPCLIGVEGCTNALKDGDKIKVINGKIYKVK